MTVHTNGKEMVDSRIIRFFRRHHVLTIATSVNDEPWCASCFYVYLKNENALVFTTDTSTRHGQEFIKNKLVAGSVVLETRIIGKIRGIQFQGTVSEPVGNSPRRSQRCIHETIPCGNSDGDTSLDRPPYPNKDDR